MKSVICKNCGTSDLYWYKNKNGNWILITKQSEIYERGTGHWVEPHNCQKISKIKNENIAIFEKQIEATKKLGAEQGLSEEVINFLVAEIEEKIAVQKEWQK